MIYYLLLVFSSLLTALAQIVFKIGAKRLDLDKGISFNIRNKYLLVGLLLFSVCPFLSIAAMRVIDFSIFYSFTALNYFFIMLFSIIILKEKVDKFKIAGNCLIVVGIIIFSI